MLKRLTICILAIVAWPLHAQSSAVTVNQLQGRSHDEIAGALAPLMVEGLELRSFNFSVPYGPFPSPGNATAIFDYRSYYAENGLCVQDQFWVTFTPEVERGPRRGQGEGSMPGEILTERRDGPLRLSSIEPTAIYWLASRDLESELPDRIATPEEHALLTELARVQGSLCQEPPEDVRFFGARDKETASRGVAALRRIVERLASDPSSLSFECAYSDNVCAELRSHVALNQLGGIRACDHMGRDDSCVEFSVGATGTTQGTYVNVRVRTTSDFDSPDDFTISLQSRSFVAH